MYTIEATNQTVKSYFKAVEIATELDCNVLLNGNVKWEPAPKVSAKRNRDYTEGLQARKAYEKMRGI